MPLFISATDLVAVETGENKIQENDDVIRIGGLHMTSSKT